MSKLYNERQRQDKFHIYRNVSLCRIGKVTILIWKKGTVCQFEKNEQLMVLYFVSTATLYIGC